MSSEPGQTTQMIANCLERLHEGEANARGELIQLSAERLRKIASRMLRNFQRNVPRGLETDDVLNDAVLRLWRVLEQETVEIPGVRQYFALSAQHIRWTLLEMVRQRKFVEAPDQEPARADTQDPVGSLADWAEFHEKVEQLNDEEREIFNLMFYHGLRVEEAAETLGVAEVTVRRRWSRARRHLRDLLGPDWFPSVQE